MLKTLSTLFATALLAAGLSAQTIFLYGDSTCANYPAKEKPMTGWGQCLQPLCRPGVKVDNRAICGLTLRGAIAGGSWKKLIGQVRKGDFVLFQFGHNDQKPTNKNGFSDHRTTYRQLLKRLIREVKAKGATPILVSSIVRGTYRQEKLADSGPQGYELRRYAEAMRQVAAEEKTGFIDFNAYLAEKLSPLPQKEVVEYFMTSSGRADHKGDLSHLTKAGAERFARYFVEAAKEAKSPVARCFR